MYGGAMKRIYVSIGLLYALNQNINAIEQAGRVINASIIANVDGKFPAHLLIKFLERVKNLIEHNYASQGTTVIKLRDLVKYEKALPPEKAQTYLNGCITRLINMAQEESFFSMFYVAYPIFEQIVEEWATQFNMRGGKFYPFVKSWKKLGTEYDLLISQLHSLQDFEQYVLELHQFLSDFLVSCPQAYDLYQSRTQ